MLRMLAHSPATLHPILALGTACLSQITLPESLRELLALFCGIKFGSKYVWSRHVGDALKRGVTRAQLDALQREDFVDTEVWSERDMVFLRFLGEVIDSPTAGDASFSEATKWFDNQQIMEILIAQVSEELLLIIDSVGLGISGFVRLIHTGILLHVGAGFYDSSSGD
jgi:alkylhydroperoxidase family enzyme